MENSIVLWKAFSTSSDGDSSCKSLNSYSLKHWLSSFSNIEPYAITIRTHISFWSNITVVRTEGFQFWRVLRRGWCSSLLNNTKDCFPNCQAWVGILGSWNPGDMVKTSAKEAKQITKLLSMHYALHMMHPPVRIKGWRLGPHLVDLIIKRCLDHRDLSQSLLYWCIQNLNRPLGGGGTVEGGA
jgi:hypothetical protein